MRATRGKVAIAAQPRKKTVKIKNSRGFVDDRNPKESSGRVGASIGAEALKGMFSAIGRDRESKKEGGSAGKFDRFQGERAGS
jgi:hypothetical protein